jgi:hypothetical protein
MTRPQEIIIIIIQAIASQPSAPRPKRIRSYFFFCKESTSTAPLCLRLLRTSQACTRSRPCAQSAHGSLGSAQYRLYQPKQANVVGSLQQASQARRRVKTQGLKAQTFGNCGRVFDQLIAIRAGNGGVSTASPAKTLLPAHRGPLGAAGRYCLRPFHQLVEISKRSL